MNVVEEAKKTIAELQEMIDYWDSPLSEYPHKEEKETCRNAIRLFEELLNRLTN